MKNGALVISLDFELLWGVFDKVNWEGKVEYFETTRKVIPEILKLFEKHQISCTWATVGMLFNENWDEWNSNIPKYLPDYENKKLSAYRYGKSIQSKKTEKLCFAPNLIKQIKNTENQEIGTHTYSHYYCLEPGQILDSFQMDLEKSIELAKKSNIAIKSLVFPRNQFNENYLDICAELGIENVRSNPDDWYWKDTQKDSLLQKVFRTGDAYLGVNNKSYPRKEIEFTKDGLQKQKASRLLRPYSLGKLNIFKLKRISSEMEAAARKGEIYHLWWHPHNFGINPLKNLNDLESLLIYYKILQNKYHMNSLNMNELNQYSFVKTKD